MEPTGEMKEFIEFIEADSGLDWHDAYNRFVEQRARIKFKSKGVARELGNLKRMGLKDKLKPRVDDSLSKETFKKALTGKSDVEIDPTKVKVGTNGEVAPTISDEEYQKLSPGELSDLDA